MRGPVDASSSSRCERKFPSPNGDRRPVGFLFLLCCVAGCRLAAFVPNEPVPEGNAQIEYLLRVPKEVLPPEHPLFAELNAMPAAIRQSLELPPAHQNVRVFLFEDRAQYRSFLDDFFPHLPDRRAYFVAADDALAVYAYWSPQTREDLRHELTHAVLHASLTAVPLWLDEGLAEYFETPTGQDDLIPEHVALLAQARSQGWHPNLERLESYTEVSDMTRRDYAEAWAWVHWLLGGPVQQRRVLMDYLQTFQNSENAARLNPQLTQVVGDPAGALNEWLFRR